MTSPVKRSGGSRLLEHVRVALQVPEGAILPTDQENIQVLARGVRRVAGPLDAYFDIFFQEAQPQNGLTCEMIYWERPEGGRVFNAGAVGASWVLGVDTAFERLLTNVLHHFGVTAQGSEATDKRL